MSNETNEADPAATLSDPETNGGGDAEATTTENTGDADVTVDETSVGPPPKVFRLVAKADCQRRDINMKPGEIVGAVELRAGIPNMMFINDAMRNGLIVAEEVEPEEVAAD